MARQKAVPRGWRTYEVYQRDDAGNHTLTPFSLALAGGSGGLPTQAITKMRMVQAIGWPEAKRQLKDDFSHPLIVKKDDFIWLLKCKPSCWRLYFYVWEKNEKEGGLVYVHAVCKKADEEDPGDATYARRVHEEIGSGRSAITFFEFPPN